jgi:hypothetical protein
MLRSEALVRIDVSEERNASIITIILVHLMMGAIRSSEISVLTRVTLRNITEDDILQIYHCLHSANLTFGH